jgi:hypothetical protein
MSHDTEAAYASSEIADIIMNKQESFFGKTASGGVWSVYAGREGGHQWPLTDGVILAQQTLSKAEKKIAFEFKRLNEGIHGILTALGQSFAYLEKGYDATVMVIPNHYSSHSNPGQHIQRIIDSTAPEIPISIYTYSTPNLSATRPFQGKLNCIRDISLPDCRKIKSMVPCVITNNVSTLWAHMREGMSHPDAFFRYCQSVKISTSINEDFNNIKIPNELIAAVSRIDPKANVYKYLSNTSGDNIPDRTWRFVWFNYYFWNDMMPIYNTTHPYAINDTPTKIRIDDENYQKLFSGRSDSIKTKLINILNDPESTISVDEVWEQYAKKVRSDSHSYREVIDSGLYHIGFLTPEGYLTDLGYKYVDACERFSSPYSGLPLEILRASVLQNGQYGALLHYFYKLSEDMFSSNLLAFTIKDSDGNHVFQQENYLNWLNDIFVNTLHILRKSTERAGGTRKPFQAEISFLKKMGFVKSKRDKASYRVGVGIEIDWPQVQNSMLYFQTL